ncbi:MAG: polyprenyl synthetase family protein [Clostridiales bacterium]|nr:polyprenyl synthetase family protein [Clostridiales bacterium]MDY3774138.1 farnesyl diphosphate synthase [Eubacterium sp.]
MKVEEILKERAKEAEDKIVSYLPEIQGYPKTILDAMAYSVEAGGKRIRPVLMREVYEMCGGTKEDIILPFMAAIEMIHTYSLIHDDLPAMDNDEYRRGKLTTHKKYGEAMGILAGDALLNYAYETALQAFDKAVEEKELRRIAEALKVLAGKAGIYGMVGGQVVDVEKDGDFVDEDMLMYVYVNKTSALLESCFMIGGILAGCSREQVEILEKSARNLGVAFQIQDDILDVVGDAKTLGKPVGSDARNEKTTYVSMYGLEEARKKVSEYTEESIVLLQNFDGEKTFLIELMTWMIQRDK